MHGKNMFIVYNNVEKWTIYYGDQNSRYKWNVDINLRHFLEDYLDIDINKTYFISSYSVFTYYSL